MAGYRNQQARARAAYIASGGHAPTPTPTPGPTPTPTPGAPVYRFASSYNGIAQSTNGQTFLGHANRWPHTMKTAQKRVRFAFPPWNLPAGKADGSINILTNTLPITAAYASCNGVVVPVLFSGIASKTIQPTANAIEDVGSDWLTPEQFGYTGSFPANTTIWITFNVLRNTTADLSPAMLGRTTSDQTGSQTWFYDPSATTVTLNNVSQMTSAGTAPSARANGWMPWLIGEPENANERVYIARGDSITQGIGDGTTTADGRGWFQIACSAMGINCANFSVSGMTSQGGATDPKVSYWYQFANRGIVSTGTNDFGTDGSATAATVQGRTKVLVDQMRAAGIAKVGGIKLLVRKESNDTWMTEANQSVGAFTGWVPGANPDLYSQAQGAQGYDFVIPFTSIRGVDPFKWKVNGVAKGFANDDTHPSNGGHTAMGTEATAIMQQAG